MQQTHAAQAAPQTVPRYVKRMDIRYRGAKIRVRMGCLPCGILVQLIPRTITIANGKIEKMEIAPGDVWVPNRELSRATKRATEYHLCADLYDAFRLCLHASDGYGHGSDRSDAESVKLDGTIVSARSLASGLFQRRGDAIETRAANDERQMTLAADLLAKRDENKVRAGNFFLASLRTLTSDRLGRPNPGGAAMQIGAGIAQLKKRLFAIAKIDDRVVSRATVLADFIEDHLRVYDALWHDLLGEPRPQTRGEIWRMIYLIGEGLQANATPFARREGERQLRVLVDRLASHRDAFLRMQAAPFRRNAYHLARDLELAISIADGTVGPKELASLIERLETMERGMRWMYALNALQFELICPLSVLLANEPGAPDERFAFVRPSLEDFDRRMTHRCSDKNLRTPVKDEAKRLITDALKAADERQWLEVKTRLKSLAAIL